MTALKIILIILAILLIIAMFKVGVFAAYSKDGAELACFAGPVRIKILPQTDKKSKNKKEKFKKKKKKKKSADRTPEEKKEKKGGSAALVLKLLPGIGEALGNFRKKLSIDILKVYYTYACDDPYKAAMGFGYASAGLGTITALIRRFFKVKELDMRSNVSFEETEPVVYLEAQFSIRIWESLAIALKFLIFFLKVLKETDNKQTGTKA